MFRKLVFTLFILAFLLPEMTCYGGDFRIIIVPEFKGQPLRLSKQLYVSGQNDSLYIDAFRCYLSCFRFSQNGKVIVPDSSAHLVDASEPGSLEIMFHDLPAGKYTALGFDIGVDSLSNVSGAMGGDLDPTKGMYWAWNTGFINAKLEGRSPVCKTLHHAFEFHIGGYMRPFNTLRPVLLLLNKCTVKSNNKTEEFRLVIDLSLWLDPIRLAETNSVVMPSEKAVGMADNYTKMFSIYSISTNNED